MSQIISVAKALMLLKNTEKKIENAIPNVLLTANTKGIGEQQMVVHISSLTTVDEASNYIKESFQGINDLIKLRNELKSKILISNATTLLKIGDEEMTVAEAIDRKAAINMDNKLLATLREKANKVLQNHKVATSNFNDKLEKSRENFLSSNKKYTEDEIKVFTKPIVNSEQPEILDPLNASKILKELEEKINTFKAEVDFALNESNVITKIEISETVKV